MAARRTAEETAALRASLLDHAATLVRREGAQALTMRALAAEAGCAVGLPYKIFASRDELVAELVGRELHELTRRLDDWTRRAGTASVAENLAEYAAILLGSETPALVHANATRHEALAEDVHRLSRSTGLVASFDGAVAAYLRAEQRAGRVRPDVDAEAYGFLVTGAVHNLVTAGESYPRPSRDRLRELLAHVAASIGT